MAGSPDTLAELGDLLGGLVDGRLSPDGRERLAQVLRHNPDAQNFYRDYIALHAALEYRFGTPSAKFDGSFSQDTLPAPGAGGGGGERLPFSDAMIVPALDAPDEHADPPEIVAILTPEAMRDHGKSEFRRTQHRTPWIRWALAAGVALVAGVSLFVVSRQSQTSLVSRQPPAPPPTLARITDQVNAAWAQSLTDDSLVAGSRLRLTEGLAELTFTSGAKVVLQAPADFTIDAGDKLSLAQGKLAARIEGGGFSVHTPSAVVTDLGTEFAVRVDRDQATRVEVFEGQVTAQPLKAGPETPPSLTAGQAADVSSQSVQMDQAGSRPDAFVRSLAAVIVRGKLAADLRPDLSPEAPAWTNHATGDVSVGDFAPTSPGTLSVQSVRTSPDGPDLHGLQLGQNATTILRSAKSIPALLTGSGDVSVEAWVLTNGDSDFKTLAYWGKHDVGAQRAFMVGQNTPFMGYYADVNGWDAHPPSPGSWHYLAWTYASAEKQFTVYCDGQLVTTAKVNLTTAPSPMFLGARPNNASGSGSESPLNGTLGAFRVHTGTLRRADVQHNFKLGMGNAQRIAIEN